MPCYIAKCSVRSLSVPRYIVLETHTVSTETKEKSPQNYDIYSSPSIVPLSRKSILFAPMMAVINNDNFR